MGVVVLGSINMDLVARTPRLPIPGETITGRTFETVPGGKGANQAVAAARLDCSTELIGRVGGDRFGEELLAGLKTNRVKCDRVTVDPSTHSGVAMIAVDDASENHIIVIPGANGRVGEAELDRLQAVLSSAASPPKVLLLQLEVPLEVVVAAAQAAQAADVLVMLDPAPARSELPAALYPALDLITPNQVEASQLVGYPVVDRETAIQAAKDLHQRGVQTVIIKLGKLGAVCVTPTETLTVPSFPVEAVDTVAAGDAFNGGLAAGLAEGRSLQAALTQASAVAALSVTKAGAQPSLPSRQELLAFLETAQR